MTISPEDIAAVEAGLEKSILYGLSCEWDTAAEDLPSDIRDRLRKPLFSLKDMNGQLGQFLLQRNEIVLSRAFVLQNDWGPIREVLRHEMAHQLALQVWGASEEAPHGPAFRRACRHVRAMPQATGNYELLESDRSIACRSAEDRLLLRIRKLMALAGSSNRHEAEAAAAKAHHLVVKYNIDLQERHGRRDFGSVCLGRPALRHFREEYHLAALLQDFYFVEGIWVPAYVVAKAKMGRVLEISGTPANLKIAAHVHAFIERFIASQWQQYNHGKGLNRYRRSDFAEGIIAGFRTKLTRRSRPQPRDAGGHALIPVEDPQLRRYLKQRYPRTARFQHGGARSDPSVRRDGHRIGRRLVIWRGVHQRGHGRKRLLPP